MREIHDKLNPKIFRNENEMIPEVRERLLEIVEEFLSTIDENFEFNIFDIRLVGSNASYNYTDTSDIDLHIVVDMYEICSQRPDIVQYLFNAEKSRFNLEYDITLKGIQVEIYVEDIRAMTLSNGIYSIVKDDWEKVPTEDYYESESIYDSIENGEYAQRVYDKVKQSLDYSESASQIKIIINDLYMMRKSSLESTGTEDSYGNVIFKKVRSMGWLDELKDKYFELRSKELSLESLIREAVEEPKYQWCMEAFKDGTCYFLFPGGFYKRCSHHNVPYMTKSEAFRAFNKLNSRLSDPFTKLIPYSA